MDYSLDACLNLSWDMRYTMKKLRFSIDEFSRFPVTEIYNDLKNGCFEKKKFINTYQIMGKVTGQRCGVKHLLQTHCKEIMMSDNDVNVENWSYKL